MKEAEDVCLGLRNNKFSKTGKSGIAGATGIIYSGNPSQNTEFVWGSSYANYSIRNMSVDINKPRGHYLALGINNSLRLAWRYIMGYSYYLPVGNGNVSLVVYSLDRVYHHAIFY